MAKQRQRHCANCDTSVLAIDDGPNHVLHLLITLMTMGLWFPVWIIVAASSGKFRCSKCGAVTQ